MKREEILAMEPGEELDGIVSREIFAVEMIAHVPYSSDISAAWEVVRKLSKDYGVNVFEDDGAPCECTLVRYPETVAVVGGSSAPEVICKAALLAVLEEGETT